MRRSREGPARWLLESHSVFSGSSYLVSQHSAIRFSPYYNRWITHSIFISTYPRTLICGHARARAGAGQGGRGRQPASQATPAKEVRSQRSEVRSQRSVGVGGIEAIYRAWRILARRKAGNSQHHGRVVQIASAPATRCLDKLGMTFPAEIVIYEVSFRAKSRNLDLSNRPSRLQNHAESARRPMLLYP